MTGTIYGGWNFVWAAYGLTTTIVAIFTISLIVRFRGEVRRSERQITSER